MIVAAALWLVLCAGFAATAPRLAVSAPPAAAVRLTVGASVALAGAGLFVLGAAAATWAAQKPALAALDRLSAGRLHADSPVPPVAGMLAALLLAGAAASLAVCGWRAVGAHRAIRKAVGPATGEVVVLDDGRVDAFVTPGRRGRVVVTTGLLGALDPAEQEAVVAHETAHRRHAHAWWALAMRLSVAANPLLRRAGRAVEHAMERWADEDAAAHVGDRRLVARTVARVSLLKKHGAQAAIGLVLDAAGGDIPARVRALLEPRSSRGRLAAAALLVFLAGALAAVVLMQRTADGVFDGAHRR